MPNKLPPPWHSLLRHFVSDAWEKGQILRLLAATWPPAQIWPLGPWLMRDGQGGGKRVCAASLQDGAAFSPADLDAAEAAMRRLAQRPVFAVWPCDRNLDMALDQRGYQVIDPVLFLAAGSTLLAAALPANSFAYPHWPPLALGQEIWQAASIPMAAQKIMARAQGPKTALILRHRDQIVGLCFVAMAGQSAMLHALEVLPNHRRAGHGRSLIRAAATWAAGHGAQDLALLVTRKNIAARALYEGMGMAQRGQYHYRLRP